MEWTAVAVFVALVSLIGALIGITEKVSKPLLKNIEDAKQEIEKNTSTISRFNTDITTLEIKLENTNERLDKHRVSAHRNFEKLFEQNEKQENELINHEYRLTNLEKEKTK